MKFFSKKILTLLITCIMVISVPSVNAFAYPLIQQGNIAISPMLINIELASASLTFSGKTANCSSRVVGKVGTTEITATLTLYRVESNGSLTYQTSWNSSVKGDTLNYSNSYTVSSSGTYQLSVYANAFRDGKWESTTLTVQKSC